MHYITGLYYVHFLHDKLPLLEVQIYANSFVFLPSFLFQINASHLDLACSQPMPITCSIRLFYTLRHKCRTQKQSEPVAPPTLGQITATHQPLAVWTHCQSAITASPHRRCPDGQVYCFWFPSLLLPLNSPLPLLQALCFVKWSAMINCAENFSEGLKWSSVAPACLLNFLTCALCTKTNDCPLWNCLKQFDYYTVRV